MISVSLYYNLYIKKKFKLIIYKDSVYFLGDLGNIKYKINNFKKNFPFFKILKNGKFFLKLFMEKKNIRTFFSLIYKNYYGISFGWFFFLKYNGRGFNIFIKNNVLKFNIGLSHCIFFFIPNDIKIKCIRKESNIYLYSLNFSKICHLAYKISKLGSIDSYKGRGIYYWNKVIKLKSIKKI